MYEGNNWHISYQAEMEAFGPISRWHMDVEETELRCFIHTDEWKAVSVYNVATILVGGVPDTLVCPVIGFPQ